jgi:hypothetical protein
MRRTGSEFFPYPHVESQTPAAFSGAIATTPCGSRRVGVSIQRIPIRDNVYAVGADEFDGDDGAARDAHERVHVHVGPAPCVFGGITALAETFEPAAEKT